MNDRRGRPLSILPEKSLTTHVARLFLGKIRAVLKTKTHTRTAEQFRPFLTVFVARSRLLPTCIDEKRTFLGQGDSLRKKSLTTHVARLSF
jgi:hypothetical protein